MITDRIVTRARSRWAQRFTDTVTFAADQEGAFNTGTGEYAAVADSEVYSGPGLVQQATTDPDIEMFAQTALTTNDIIISVPWDTAGIEPGHQFTVTASNDPQLVGATGRVQAINRDSDVLRRKVLCRIGEESA